LIGSNREADERVSAATEVVFSALARCALPAELNLCGHCYSPEQLERFACTPLRELSNEDARVLLWETGDHWPDANTLKHFLPRALKELARTNGVGDLYPGHLFEVLAHHHFGAWPHNERAVISAWFDALEERFDAGETLDPEWTAARQKAGIYAGPEAGEVL